MKIARHGTLLKVLACILLPIAVAQACGPDFFPDIFVRRHRPDVPAEYVQGKLGLLQPSFARADLIVAYRYLSGGNLDPAEQKGWSPSYSVAETLWNPDPSFLSSPDASNTPVGQWMAARRQYPNAPKDDIQEEKVMRTPSTDGMEQSYFMNCQDDAFTTATATLNARAAKWGKTSASLQNWLLGQDTVFKNCAGGPVTPAAAPSGSPALLVSDRAYQIAAAHFYGMALNRAHTEFVAIGKDKGSPWQPIGGYLAARTLVRQAFFTGAAIGAPSGYNPDLMNAAAAELHDYLAAGPPATLQKAARDKLAFIEIRTDPDQRALRLSQVLGGPGHDADYAQNLKDLLWFIGKNTPDGLRAQPDPWAEVPDPNHPGQTVAATQAEQIKSALATRQAAYTATAPIRKISPLIDWTLTFESLDPSAATHALAQWQATKALPWLVAALALAPDGASLPSDVMKAAADLPASSPAWTTVAYHRIRLMSAAGRMDAARDALASALPQVAQQGQPSAMNAFKGLAMQAATTLDGFLRYAPRTLLLATSQAEGAVVECREVMKDPKRHYNCVAKVDPMQLDEHAANIFNRQAPLAVWLTAAHTASLSQQLRQAIAMAGWARAVLLNDPADAAAFLPLMPDEVRAQAGEGTGYKPMLTLLRNPGINPYLNGGVQRSYSYDFVESYSDNWCYKTSTEGPTVEPAFLNLAQQEVGRAQAAKLAPLRAAVVGQFILDYVTAHPSDPSAPEALYLILRMVRWGCIGPAASGTMPAPSFGADADGIEAARLFTLRKRAAQLLRQRYQSSPWTKKAGPIAG